MRPNFSLRLRVFNLNCWDIPYLSRRRADRLRRLGDFLNAEGFDLALLEEVGLRGARAPGWGAGGAPPLLERPAGIWHLTAAPRCGASRTSTT